MTGTDEKLLDALRCAVHGERAQWSPAPSRADWNRLFWQARSHNTLPLVAEAVYLSLDPADRFRAMLVREARQLTIQQARRTADFLLLYEELQRRGLHPAVVKGIVLRSLYPVPEQRASVDEDLLVSDAEFPAVHRALIDLGFSAVNPEAADEVTYLSDLRGLYLEVHRQLLPPSDAYGDCNVPFVDCLDRTVEVMIQDVSVRTLSPTDHLLFLICHAYKHFLHGGVGIRQLCDMGLFVQRYGNQIQWQHILDACRSLHIDRLAAAMFRIGAEHLALPLPEIFAGYEEDVQPLLGDVLSGGVYGMSDLNRAHSSTLTLEAVAAERQGRRRGGVLRSVFLPASSLEGRYTYLRSHKWLLPAAWTQRVWDYVFRQKHVDPAHSVRIARQRIDLFAKYGIISQ